MPASSGAFPAHEALRPTTAPTPQEAAIVADVHDLAAAYAGLPPEKRPGFLLEVRKLTTGFDRWKATIRTATDDPMFGPLMAMLDDLIATDGRSIVTAAGVFDRSDLANASASISPSKVSFPVSVKGGEAVYPSAATAGPNIVPFRVVRPEEVKRAPSMWGDDE
jgi:hypothetical protein